MKQLYDPNRKEIYVFFRQRASWKLNEISLWGANTSTSSFLCFNLFSRVNKFTVKLILFEAILVDFSSSNFQQISLCTGYAFQDLAKHYSLNFGFSVFLFFFFFSFLLYSKIIFHFMGLSFNCARLLAAIACMLTPVFSLQLNVCSLALMTFWYFFFYCCSLSKTASPLTNYIRPR